MTAPKPQIDLTQLAKLAEIGCPIQDVAAYFKVDAQTLKSKLKKDPLKTIWNNGQARGRIKLLNAQMATALSGDKTMQIWLGKQMLNQADKVEQDIKQQQKWVVELPPAMTADQWVAAYGKSNAKIVVKDGEAKPPKARKRKTASVVERDSVIEDEEDII